MLFCIFAIAGIVMLILGVVLYKYKKIELLSGYDSSKKYDREGLAKFTGMTLMLMGIIPIAASIILLILNVDYGELIATIIFIVDVVVFTISIVIKSPKYQLSDGVKNKDAKKFNKMIGIGLGIVVLLGTLPVVFLLIAGHNTETKINISGGEYEIKSGVISYHNTFDEIKDVYIKNTIPKFHRVSGYSMDNINKGRYTVDGLGHGTLFLNANKGPYVYIITDDGFVIINDKDKTKTMEIYREIENKVKNKE